MKIATVALAAGIALLVAVTFIKPATGQMQNPAGSSTSVSEELLGQLRALQADPLKIYPFDRVQGSLTAPVTIIEYASMTCTHCAEFHQHTMPEIERDWIATGKAKYVLRDLPWDNLAFAIAKAARCTDRANYGAAVKALFGNQMNIVTAGDTDAIVAAIAGTLEPYGLSGSQTRECINGNPSLHATIAAMRDSAIKSLGVRGTPTTFIDGAKVDGAETYAKVKPVLEKAYAAKTGAK